MEIRNYKLLRRRPGGNAGKTSIAYNLSLPSKWLKKMGVTPDKREVELSFNGTEITIKKAEEEDD